MLIGTSLHRMPSCIPVQAEEGRIITEGLSYAEDRDRVELWRSTKPENANFFS